MVRHLDWTEAAAEDLEELRSCDRGDELLSDWEPSPETIRLLSGDLDEEQSAEAQESTEAPRAADLEQQTDDHGGLAQETPPVGFDVKPDLTDAEKAQEHEAVEDLSKIEGLKPQKWEQLDDAGRLGTMQEVEDHMAELQGRPPAEVVWRDLPPEVYGYYDPDANKITIARHSLHNDGAPEVLDTTVHEGRHAYQHHVARHPGTHLNPDEEDVWRENLKPENYMSASQYGQKMYEMQPVEHDARHYAGRIRERLYGGVR